MKAIIMAGGEGTRLRPVLKNLPKPMAPLLGVPIIERIVELLKYNNIRDIRITLRYMPEAIISHFGDGSDFGVRISYTVEDEALGTAGGVRACDDFYTNRDFLVISGDAACDFDLKALFECHMRHNNAVTMALFEDPEPLSYGLVLTDRRGAVVSFIEKPSWNQVVTDRVNTGIYVLSPRAMEAIPKGLKADFAKDLFPELLRRGERMMGLPMEGYWCDIGTPSAYYQCNLDALNGRLRLFGGDEQDEPAQPPLAAEAPREGPERVRITCTDRARLMRKMSEALMTEAGADFSDGLILESATGRARVCPSPHDNSIYIEAGEAGLREDLQKLAQSLQ